MRPGWRNLALTAHVTASVGWIGAVLAYLAVVVAELARPGGSAAAWGALEVIGWLVLVPLSLAALATGLLQALGTRWGLFRHYWVVFKLGLTLFATAILLLHMPTVSLVAAGQPADSAGLRGELLHAGGGLVVLLTTVTLSVYKPKGRTPWA